MRPDFGCGIHDLVFESISSVSLGHIELSVTEALTKYEPRIELLSVDLSTEQIDNGFLMIKHLLSSNSLQTTDSTLFILFILEKVDYTTLLRVIK